MLVVLLLGCKAAMVINRSSGRRRREGRNADREREREREKERKKERLGGKGRELSVSRIRLQVISLLSLSLVLIERRMAGRQAGREARTTTALAFLDIVFEPRRKGVDDLQKRRTVSNERALAA